ncbi:MAG: alpha-ketoacid dehydrogenase subunit alpha/beta [Saprospiraceae bacterium]
MTQVNIKYDKGTFTDETLLNLYKKLLLPRMIEEKMLILLRQEKVSKWFSGIGQEAISVGCAAALLPDEMIFTMHRNLGVFTTREMPFDRMLCQWEGKENGYTNGRDRSFHFGAPEHHIVGMISHLGPQLSLAAGVALAHKLNQEGRVSLAFTGEGATSQGEFHEALNTAAVWELPVIFVIENNGYGLSTATNEQYRCEKLSDRGIGYGIDSLTIDGNNILEVFETVSALAKSMREKPRPVLLECLTFRMRGHEEASGTKYVPKELMDTWAKKDPIANFEKWLLEIGVLSDNSINEIRKANTVYINTSVKAAENFPSVHSTEEAELADVYAPHNGIAQLPQRATEEKRFIDAISEGLREAMCRHPRLVLMGQDIAEYGGAFKITDGFVKQFGKERVRNTPLCESAIVGIGLGLSMKNYKAMVEMQFADFVTCGFNQIINNLAKIHYRWAHKADVVIRMPTGGTTAAGPFHSQSNEAWFTHTPGLKVVYPSNPYDAKGLLLASFEDPNPIMFFEHKAMYRSVTGELPDGFYTVEIGKAKLVKQGADCSIITYGMGVHWAIKICSELGIDADILDLRTLAPIDYPAIENTVKKTNRVMILHEDIMSGGIGADLSAYISEHLFEYLDAPVLRAAGLDTPIPFARAVEREVFMPEHRFRKQLQKLLSY